MADQQRKKNFIASLKRLKYFYDNVSTYEPSQEQLKAQNFLKRDLTQQYRIFQYTKEPDDSFEEKQQRTRSNSENASNKTKDQAILDFIMSEKNQVPDQPEIASMMEVLPHEMKTDYKKDQEWFEDASNAIRQTRKFQHLIHRQENQFYKGQIDFKQGHIDKFQQEVNDQKDQHNVLEKNIQEKKNIVSDIKDEIKQLEDQAKEEIRTLKDQLYDIQEATNANKKEYTEKISHEDKQLDEVKRIRHALKQELQEIKQSNKMTGFFPVKVQEQSERIERKKVELELYRKIITETLGYMKQRIQENKEKQLVVNEINSFVGEQVGAALQEEQAYYESSDRDQLKTPPFVYVKRIERPGHMPVQTRNKAGGSLSARDSYGKKGTSGSQTRNANRSQSLRQLSPGKTTQKSDQRNNSQQKPHLFSRPIKLVPEETQQIEEDSKESSIVKELDYGQGTKAINIITKLGSSANFSSPSGAVTIR